MAALETSCLTVRYGCWLSTPAGGRSAVTFAVAARTSFSVSALVNR
ncbi:hypothetical protein [Nonomuraea salmonea]